MRSQEEPVRVDDFQISKKLPAAYELQPGKSYLIVCGGKQFSHELAERLFREVAEMGFNIHVVITAHPEAVEVREKDEQSNLA